MPTLSANITEDDKLILLDKIENLDDWLQSFVDSSLDRFGGQILESEYARQLDDDNVVTMPADKAGILTAYFTNPDYQNSLQRRVALESETGV